MINEKKESLVSLSEKSSQSIMTIISGYAQEYPMFVYFLVFLIMTIRYMDLDIVNMFLFFILICYMVQRFSVIELFYLGFTTPICEWKALMAKSKKTEKNKRNELFIKPP